MRRRSGPAQVAGDAEAGWVDAAVRTATVAVLLAVAVIGLRARGAFSDEPSSRLTDAGGRVITGVFAAAEGAGLTACIVVLALLVRRPKRRKRDDERGQQPSRLPVPWWAKTLGVLLALALLVAPFVILLAGRGHKAFAPPALTLPSAPLPGTGHQVAPTQGSPTWPLLAGMIVAVAAVLTLAILARRRRHQENTRTPNRAPGTTPLAEGLAAGSDALLAGGEPRKAIIACYAAMERGFAAAGSAPAPADTPAEVLARATAAGVVRSASAEVLTGLFRVARYSTRPMTSADSGAAATALAQMRADLADSAGTRSRADLGAGP